jgi:uncharacterized protein YjdB
MATTGQITPTITPSNATNKAVTYTSANTSIATVSASGLVTAVAVGDTTITVATVDGGFSKTVNVNVTASAVAVTGLTVSPTSLSLTLP